MVVDDVDRRVRCSELHDPVHGELRDVLGSEQGHTCLGLRNLAQSLYYYGGRDARRLFVSY